MKKFVESRTARIALWLLLFALLVSAVAIASARVGYAKAEAQATDSAMELYSATGRGEEIMNEKTVGVTSRTKYLVMIDKDLWTWRVYEKEDGKWTSISSGLCRIGNNVEEGEYTVGYIFESFEFGGGEYRNAVWMNEKRVCISSWGGVAPDVSSNSDEVMFTYAVIVKPDTAQWIRENCMSGTKVVVFGSMI